MKDTKTRVIQCDICTGRHGCVTHCQAIVSTFQFANCHSDMNNSFDVCLHPIRQLGMTTSPIDSSKKIPDQGSLSTPNTTFCFHRAPQASISLPSAHTTCDILYLLSLLQGPDPKTQEELSALNFKKTFLFFESDTSDQVWQRLTPFGTLIRTAPTAVHKRFFCLKSNILTFFGINPFWASIFGFVFPKHSFLLRACLWSVFQMIVL